MRQTLNLKGTAIGVKMVNLGTIEKPKIQLTIYSKTNLSRENTGKVMEEFNWKYGLNEDISQFSIEFKNDKFLKPTFKRLLGMRNNCANSLYELLIISMVLQNATVRRTVQMMNNLFSAYGTKVKFDNKELSAYWSPEDLRKVSEDELRALKVGYRARMIQRISESFANEEIDEFKLRKMNTEDAEKELRKLYGVGPATAQIILGGYLRRYNTFNLKARFWEQKILSRVIFGKKLVPYEQIVEEFEKRYGKWRGLAFHYIFTDLFWRHKEKPIAWLQKEIRL
jgi:N-glycosylase/DNA lyase